MEHLFQENLPKLLPSWHDLSVQDLVQLKSHKRFFQDKLPDFGGTGIDVCIKENVFKFHTAKHTADEINFSAGVCSLPFFPPRKVSLKSDPCLMSVNTSKSELKKFSVALDHLRRYANKADGKLQEELLSAHQMAENINSKKGRKKIKKFFIPDSIIHLATEFPKSDQLPAANFDYLGGCLASSQTVDGSHILLHPVGKKLNKLGVTPLEEICDLNKTFQPGYSKINTVKLKNHCIHKISSAFPGHCFVQQKRFCQYVNFTNPSSISVEQLFRKCGNFVNIAASPHDPMELISIDEKGVLELQDVDSWETIWISDKVSYEKPMKNATLKACAFGSHPKSVLSLTENSVRVYDLRLDKKDGLIIFSKHFSSFPEEMFLNFKSLAVINPFQHLISSTNHLYICDERYPKKPVLIWSHLFKSFPLYCDIACCNLKDSSDAVALLGTQESRELSLFTVRSQESQIQPISLSTPLFLSSPSDFTDSLKLHAVHVNSDLIDRTMNPLIGICAIPSSKKTGFTAFQLTSFGDVFFQDFDTVSTNEAEHTYRVDTGCTLTPPDRILPHISQWNDFFSKLSKKAHSRSNLVSINVDLKEILNNSPDISSGCDLCSSDAYLYGKEVVSTTNCSSCGLDNAHVLKSQDAFNNLGVLAGPVVDNIELDNFDVPSLSEFQDEYSKEILKPWNNADDADRASPIDDLDSFSCLSFDSTKSGTSTLGGHSTVVMNRNESFNATQSSDIVGSTPSIHSALFKEDTIDFPFPMQDSFEEFVPASQDIRPIIGETLRTPSKSKISVKKNISLAGF